MRAGGFRAGPWGRSFEGCAAAQPTCHVMYVSAAVGFHANSFDFVWKDDGQENHLRARRHCALLPCLPRLRPRSVWCNRLLLGRGMRML